MFCVDRSYVGRVVLFDGSQKCIDELSALHKYGLVRTLLNDKGELNLIVSEPYTSAGKAYSGFVVPTGTYIKFSGSGDMMAIQEDNLFFTSADGLSLTCPKWALKPAVVFDGTTRSVIDIRALDADGKTAGYGNDLQIITAQRGEQVLLLTVQVGSSCARLHGAAIGNAVMFDGGFEVVDSNRYMLISDDNKEVLK